MSGVTKHIFDSEIRDIKSMWNQQIQSIQCVLPQDYSEKDVIDLLKRYYPHEWHSVEIKYEYYKQKDRFIKRRFGKARYNMTQRLEEIENEALEDDGSVSIQYEGGEQLEEELNE